MIYHRVRRFIRYIFFVCQVISKGGFISPLATVHISRGAVYTLGNNVRIYRSCRIVLSENAQLILGSNCIINPYCSLLVRSSVTIEHDVKVAHMCTIVDHNYTMSPAYRKHKFSSVPITIGLFCSLLFLLYSKAPLYQLVL